MKVDVVFGAGGITPAEAHGRTVVVIDVLRASTSIVVALANGARNVVPFESADEAVARAKAFDRSDYVLAGERRMARVEVGKAQRGALPQDSARNDNFRARRYVAKYTINPAITHGISHVVGSIEPGKLADLTVDGPLAVTPPVVGSASTTSGQATFNIQDMQMLVGNGTTADQKWRVFVGEVTVAAAVVSAITWYALQGRYAAVPVAFTTSVAYTFAHNIGVPIEFLDVAPYARSPSSSGPWLPAPLSYSGSTAFPIAGLFGATSRLAVCCYTGAAGVFYDNASNGGNTASSGDLMVRVTRGW